MSGVKVLDSHASPSRSHASGPRLLIIEDDAATYILISKVAEKLGFISTSAACLEDASELLRSGCYDCITLDLLLGRNSAVALFRTLAGTASATPIIIISGSPDWARHSAESLGKAARLNIVATITKPIEFGGLREILTSVRECKSNQPRGDKRLDSTSALICVISG